jgi:REP element-mobilizing transposase RayT
MGGVRRRDLPDGYFHVTARGVNGSAIFLEDVDRLDFLDVLARVAARLELPVLARCLMDTHYHLIVAATTEKLSAAMQRLNGTYALRFNRRHGRRGHVFGERFSSWVISDDEHLSAALRYVVDNPVKAGMCSAGAEWPWTRVDLDQLRS